MYQAILFDLDGTLLPMDNDEFTKGYLSILAKEVAYLGYKAEELIPAMWKGVSSMVKNDGTVKNYQAFWKTFASIMGEQVYEHIPIFDNFYENKFNDAIVFTKPTPKAKTAVQSAAEKSSKLVLATNPLFPTVAQKARLNWAGIPYDMFDLVTDYDNSGYCKPNPLYYIEISKKLGVDPKSCLMIGNNTKEDIEAAQKAGLDTFLLTDYLIQEGEMPDTKKGNFDELIRFLDSI